MSHENKDHFADPLLDDMLSREVLVDNRSNSAEQDDYPINLEIDETQLFFAAQDNIRFVDENLTIISHWSESFPNLQWVAVPKIAASSMCALQMCYGAPFVGSTSNSADIFEFFDDFEELTCPTMWGYNKVKVEPQEKYVDNPILEKGAGAAWDSEGIRDNSLLTDPYGNVTTENGKYIMYFHGKDSTAKRHIGRATFGRPNKTRIDSMTKDSNNPLLSPADMGWSGGKTYSPCVIKKGTSDYIMYFCGAESGDVEIYYATSSDGINWSPNTTPILSKAGHNMTMVNVRKIQYGTNAGKLVLYAEYDATSTYLATSNSYTSGWSWDVGNPVISASDISWATAGPCNPKFIELGDGEYILGMNGYGTNWRGGFMKSSSLNSGWTDYGSIVLDVGSGGTWDDVRIESVELIKEDIGDIIIGMLYFGCPTTDSVNGCAIGYTTITQNCDVIDDEPNGWTINSYCTFKVCSDGKNGQGAELDQTSGSNGGIAYQDITAITTDNDRCFEVQIKPKSAHADTYYYVAFHDKAQDKDYGPHLAFRNDGNISYKDSGGTWQVLQSWVQNTWYRLKFYNIDIANDQFDIDINGVSKGTNLTFRHTVSELSRIGSEGYATEPDTLVVSDNYIIRKHSSPEPTAELGVLN